MEIVNRIHNFDLDLYDLMDDPRYNGYYWFFDENMREFNKLVGQIHLILLE